MKKNNDAPRPQFNPVTFIASIAGVVLMCEMFWCFITGEFQRALIAGAGWLVASAVCAASLSIKEKD